METAGQRYLRSLRENNNNEQPSVSTSTTKETAGQKYLRSLREERAAKVGGGRGLVNPENVQPPGIASNVIASVVSPIDAVINMVGSAPAGVARAMERIGGGVTSEQADEIQERLTPPQNILGNALGVTEVQDYKNEGARAAIETAGEFMGKGVKAVADFFKISEGDAESMISVLTARTPPGVKAAEKVADVAVQIPGKVADVAVQIPGKVADAAKAAGKVADAGAGVAKAAGTGVAKAAKSAGAAIADAGTGVAKAAKSAGTTVADVAVKIPGKAVESVVDIVAGASGFQQPRALSKVVNSASKNLSSAATDKVLQRITDANEVGIPLSRGQALRDKDLFTEEDLLKKQEGGEALLDLANNQSRAIKGKLTSDYDAEQAGNTIVRFVEQKYKKDKEAYQKAYEEAASSPEFNTKLKLTGAIDLKTGKPRYTSNTARALESATAVDNPVNKAIKSSAEFNNLFEQDIDGSFSIKEGATIGEISAFQKRLNELASSDSSTKNFLLGQVRTAIKSDIVNTLGKKYGKSQIGKANTLYARFQKNFDSDMDDFNNKVKGPLSKIIHGQADGVKILDDLINKNTPTQLKKFLDKELSKFYIKGGKETAIRDLVRQGNLDSILKKMEDARGTTLNPDGTPNLITQSAYNVFADELKKLKKVDKNGVSKLEVIHGKEGARILELTEKVYKDIVELPNGAYINTSNTALTTAGLLKKFLSAKGGGIGAGTGLAGFLSASAAGPVGLSVGAATWVAGIVADVLSNKAIRSQVQNLVKNDPELKEFVNFTIEELKNPNAKPTKQPTNQSTNQP